ncbi:MAG: hypothetical protein JSV78_08765 [Phycisphaerales bacterium]|nr:MAG: hypothetical protein JSV78_08765 [Phycisphaerales bacterium]
MTDDLDRILASEEAVTPSAGFVDRVMKEIRRVCEATAPLHFPWRRFLVGLVGGVLCTLLSGAILLARAGSGLRFPGMATWIDPALFSYAGGALLVTIGLAGSLLVVRVAVDTMSD